MYKILKKIFKICVYTCAILVLFITIFCIYVYNISDIPAPKITETYTPTTRTQADTNVYTYKKNWLRKNHWGNYEMYIEGSAFERGTAFGVLAKELIQFQEKAFTNEIQRLIPSKKYLRFLKYIVGFMNRDLVEHITPEYQQEIYGISLAADTAFNWIGTNYSRQLNYHAAHDIGHALKNMMLVGCTSFATWGQRSQNNDLILGRNFDFYVGDDFAKNKIIAFVNPSQGYPFMYVTWGGFAGVVSGMNMRGLTVTINAAKSDIPFSSATPVSLVAREILQYASNIAEAKAIATKRKMFVSESFLIGSASENKAIIIEKTPSKMDVYESQTPQILCTNHYQSNLLKNQALNQEQIKNSASMYRYQRLQSLLDSIPANTPQTTASILRNNKGMQNVNIGLGNEKAINQFIAHHSIIFNPSKLLVWVSTTSWQEGEYICYDLKKVFNLPTTKLNAEICEQNQNIVADTFMQSIQYKQLLNYKHLVNLFKDKKNVSPTAIIQSNPMLYEAHRIAAEIYVTQGKLDSAKEQYQQALQLEIPTQEEKDLIKNRLQKIEKN